MSMSRVRLRDVADLAGVSMKTVSNVVRDHPHVSESMRVRVQKAIDELGYRPHANARNLATGRTGMIALAIPNMTVPYFGELADAFARHARERGYRLLLEQTFGSLERERQILDAAESGLIDGLVFNPSEISREEIALGRVGVPMVLLGEAPAPLSVDRVMIDNLAAARLSADHLIASGRTKIGFLGHEAERFSHTSRLRLAGYQSALEAADLPVDPGRLLKLARPAPGRANPIDPTYAYSVVLEALDRGVELDGLVCRDDLAAFGALRAFETAGVRVPDDIAVVGWDDVVFARFCKPTLTSISPDHDAIVVTALDMLAERIAGFDGPGRHELSPFSLAVRESAPAPVDRQGT